MSPQDYSNALRVTVRGQATLKLITDKPTLKMDSQTNMVRDSDDDDNSENDNDDDFNYTDFLLFSCSSQ